MSFLPHADTKGLAWYGSMTASAATHAGVIAFFMLSGAVAFLPDPVESERPEPEFAVSLEILDAEIVGEADVIDESMLIPPDAIPLEPDTQTEAELPDSLTALDPDQETLAPDDTALAPEQDVTQPDDLALTEPDVTEPEAIEPEAAEPEPVEPEVVEQQLIEPEPAPQEVAALQPEETVIAPVPEPEPAPLPLPTVAEPEPETPSPLAIEGISPIDDTVLNPLAESRGGLVADVGPEQDSALLLTPEASPEPDVLALLTPEPVPEIPLDTPAIAAPESVVLPEPEATPPETTEPETTEPEATAPEADETPAASPPPAPRALSNPTASDIAIGQLLRRIRALPQTQCTLILPRRASGNPGAGISLIGTDLDVLDDLAERVTANLGFEPVQTREEIDPRQCATLDILRQAESYPASRIGLALESTSLASGDTLNGRVIGAGGLFVTLLLIDDNGVVQDMTPFVRLEDDVPLFAAPVARSGPVRATRQILLALGTQAAPLDIEARIGNVSQTVFAPIPGDTLRNMVFGVATFDVR